MPFTPILIDHYENATDAWTTLHKVMRIGAGSRIFNALIEGPLCLNRNTQLGPDVKVGKYVGMNESCFMARGEIGAFCAIGARTSINPFNHPTDWLSIHEFQYHPKSYDWVPEWNDFRRLERTPEMFERTVIGNDVWMGHNASVLPGGTVGDGAVIGIGSVVTKPVPPYAIVAGVPATIRRFRFDETTIERLLKVRWWEFDLSELSNLNFRDVKACLPRLEEIRARKEDERSQPTE